MAEPSVAGPPGDGEDLRAVGDRIESLLSKLGSLPDRQAGQWAEDLARCLTELYGAGLERVIRMSIDAAAPRGPALLEVLAADDLVASLLLVHDLHPLSPPRRLEQALAALRTELPEVDVRLVGLDEKTSTARLRLATSATSAQRVATLEEQVRAAIEAAVPELERVEIDRLLPATPVRFRERAVPAGGVPHLAGPDVVEAAAAR